MLTIDDLRQRAERLEQLSHGLSKERAIVRQAIGRLGLRERRQYLCALDDALFGVEGARVALARALLRLRGPAEADAA